MLFSQSTPGKRSTAPGSLVGCIVAAFGAFSIAVAPVRAQAQGGSKPWPPFPSNVSAACGQHVHELFDPINIAAETSRWSDVMSLATKAAKQMTECVKAYGHPRYVLFRALFESEVAEAYLNQSNHVAANRYLSLSQSDLQYVSTYTDLPANVQSALVENLSVTRTVERQAEAQGTLSVGKPSPGSSGEEASVGTSWPPDPPNVSAECGKDNEAELTNATVSAVSNKLYPNAITFATKGIAQMTACIEAYGHPEYFLFRAFFEGVAAGAYSMQREAANSIRYLRLGQSDLQRLSMYTGLPDDVQAKLEAVQKVEQAAGNIGQVGSANDSYSLHAVSCAAIAQRPPNEFWITMAQSGLAPVPKPETLLGVTFENTAQVALTDLRVHYDFLDAFGDIIASSDGVWSGTFAPQTVVNFGNFGVFGIKDLGLGGAIEKPPLANASQVKNVSCYISGARWSDGTIRSYNASGQADGENAQAPM
jgi:hypothetical protein